MFDAYQMARLLASYARRRGFEPPPAFYIHGEIRAKDATGEVIYSDAAHLYCRPCARQLLTRLRGLLPKRERAGHYIEHTEAVNEDDPPNCVICGETLDGSVSQYCVEEEVAHYREHPIAASDEINSRQAVEIAMILEAAPDDPDALAIGRDALAAIIRQEKPDADA